MHPVVLVAVGGALGGLARAGVGVLLPHQPGTWGWATLAVNTLGAFLLAVLLAREPSQRSRLLFGTGLMGAFTTFSGLMVDTVLLAEAGRPGVAAAYVLVSLAALLLAALVGSRVAR